MVEIHSSFMMLVNWRKSPYPRVNWLNQIVQQPTEGKTIRFRLLVVFTEQNSTLCPGSRWYFGTLNANVDGWRSEPANCYISVSPVSSIKPTPFHLLFSLNRRSLKKRRTHIPSPRQWIYSWTLQSMQFDEKGERNESNTTISFPVHDRVEIL